MSQKIIEQIQADFPQFNFKKSVDFRWSPKENTIFYNTKDEHWQQKILHELGHAINKDESYLFDVELLQAEMQAWETARRELFPRFNIKYDDDCVQDHLDTYREWLHKRSICPNCEMNGIQLGRTSYKCPICATIWKVNDSRFKNLRRKKK